MSELSPEARALLRAGRGMLNPSDADRARLQEALRLRLGADALPPEGAAPSPAAAAWRPSLQLIAGAFVAGAFVAGGALFVALRQDKPAERPTQASVAAVALAAPSAPLPDAPAEAPAPPAATALVAPSAPTSRASAPSARPAQESLAREVALLSQATSALHSGQPSEALKLLNEHAREFPNGVLIEERRAARAQALCMVGRINEGQAELARLAPQSPAAARAKQVCAR